MNARVKQLGWISLFADVASEMAYPILPMFLKSLGAPAVGIGAIEGFAEGLVSFVKGISGLKSDHAGKRLPFIRWGYGLSAIGKPLIGLATGWPLVLVARAIDRVGKGIRTTPRDALIAESAAPEERGRAFGLHRAMDTAGAFVGVIATLALIQAFPGKYQLIFLLAFIPGLLSVGLTFLVREPARAPNPSAAWSREQLSQLPRAYWQVLAISVLFALANSSDAFVILRTREVVGSDFLAVLAYAAYNLVYALFSTTFGKLSDRIGRRPVIGAGWIVYALVYAGLSVTGASSIWLLLAGYGLFQALAQGAGKAMVADCSPAETRGAAMGFFFMVSGFATLAGNVIAGLLWDRVSPSAMFQVSAGLAAMAAVLLVALPATRRAA